MASGGRKPPVGFADKPLINHGGLSPPARLVDDELRSRLGESIIIELFGELDVGRFRFDELLAVAVDG